MRYSNLAVLLVLLMAAASCSTEKNYRLVWNDEFDYTGLPDSTKWAYDQEGNPHGWGNDEAQFYTKGRKENAWVEDGLLHITALEESYGDKAFTSARLISKADWQYGKVEVRAKLPEARGSWAAIWMMPGGWSFNDGNWPAIGEIDIMEHVGHDKGVVHASAHSKDYQWQTGTQQTGTIKVDDATDAFHLYGLEWTPDTMKAFVDGELYFTYANEKLGVDKWPYNKPFYLIMNVAVGGAWGRVEGIDSLAFPQTMEVDYVRIYQK
ncbi:glycoside hydrolase family 16 protein [Carboxylicivirga taeanensis]|uniref:glycoside hydrolase family 16 protein n=1 Tax=Carboxylicivirga taeanensis TaxID=1416875 RepID=UPI003F6DE5A2